jgi:hypothetical protein
MSGLVGAREMRHDEIELERVEQVAALRERGDVGRAKTEPIHSSVQVQQRAALTGPTLDLLERIQHGPRLDPRERGHRTGERALEYPDLGIGRQRTQLNGLSQCRHEEPLATLAQQAARDALDSEPIGIGLDDGGAIAGLRTLAQHAEVARQRVEIDTHGRRPRDCGRLSRHRAEG